MDPVGIDLKGMTEDGDAPALVGASQVEDGPMERRSLEVQTPAFGERASGWGGLDSGSMSVAASGVGHGAGWASGTPVGLEPPSVSRTQPPTPTFSKRSDLKVLAIALLEAL